MQTRNVFLIIMLIVPLYIIIILSSNFESLQRGLINFKWQYLIFSLFFSFLAYVTRSVRWHLWLRRLVGEESWKESFLIYFSGLALLATPARIGESIRSIFIKKRYSASYSKTVPTVFVERFYDVLTICILSSIAVFFTNINKIIVIIPLILTFTIIFIIHRKDFLLSILNSLAKKKFVSKIIPNIIESTDTMYDLIHFKRLIPYTIISLAALLLDMTSYHFLVLGLNLNLNFADTILIICSSIIAGFLSLIPGGFIAMDGSILGLLTLKGIKYSDSVVFLILYRITSTLFVSIMGLIVLQHMTRKKFEN